MIITQTNFMNSDLLQHAMFDYEKKVFVFNIKQL